MADQAGSTVSDAAAKARSFVLPSSTTGGQTDQERATQERMEKAKPFALIGAGALALVGGCASCCVSPSLLRMPAAPGGAAGPV
ncbi:hypothetical protein [Arthrobacter sp. JCM 19049]|uniref:hypothetical protein n=1 Tax=Arthrobacter sp. JCM 19049 TaxID=1460643 RepID=UPI0006D04F49|nr:hypothetical protein [Arthrobacter sp. JCM 19049]